MNAVHNYMYLIKVMKNATIDFGKKYFEDAGK